MQIDRDNLNGMWAGSGLQPEEEQDKLERGKLKMMCPWTKECVILK
jgi:hypothetical protein